MNRTLPRAAAAIAALGISLSLAQAVATLAEREPQISARLAALTAGRSATAAAQAASSARGLDRNLRAAQVATAAPALGIESRP